MKSHLSTFFGLIATMVLPFFLLGCGDGNQLVGTNSLPVKKMFEEVGSHKIGTITIPKYSSAQYVIISIDGNISKDDEWLQALVATIIEHGEVDMRMIFDGGALVQLNTMGGWSVTIPKPLMSVISVYGVTGPGINERYENGELKSS